MNYFWSMNIMSWTLLILNISVVFIFGSFFGFAELLQRYRDLKYIFPKNLKNRSEDGNKQYEKTRFFSWSYIIINGTVAVIALLLIKYFEDSQSIDFKTFEINNVIIAGFGGMMVLRSYFFSIKQNDKQIDVGLSLFVQIFLDVIERNMKNSAAALRVCNIYEIMKDVDFNLAKDELPSLCIEFIDNFTREDSEKLKNKISEIASFNMSNINKSMQLGREIAYYCDEEVLRRSIKKLPHILIKTGNQQSEIDEFESRKLRLEGNQSK